MVSGCTFSDGFINGESFEFCMVQSRSIVHNSIMTLFHDTAIAAFYAFSLPGVLRGD